jgi:hypothetical protein
LANPHFTLHVKESATGDIGATAVPITDEAARRRVFVQIGQAIGIDPQPLVEGSPLVEFTVDQTND